MKFRFAYYISPKVDSVVMKDLSEMIDSFLSDKIYGNDVLNCYVGIICVEPQGDSFFKPKRPKYIEEKKGTTRDGIKYEVEKALQYEIKLDYELYLKSDEKSIKKDLSLKVLESINDLKKIKSLSKLDFNYDDFYNDLKGFMESKGLIQPC